MAHLVSSPKSAFGTHIDYVFFWEASSENKESIKETFVYPKGHFQKTLKTLSKSNNSSFTRQKR